MNRRRADGKLALLFSQKSWESSGCSTHRTRLSLGELHSKPSTAPVSSGSLEGQVFGTLNLCRNSGKQRPLGHYFQME